MEIGTMRDAPVAAGARPPATETGERVHGAAHPISVDVLIVGGGASGLTSSMLLARAGVTTHLVSRYPQTSRLPKAHFLAVKTMEIFRELGVEDEIRRLGTPPESMVAIGYYAGLAGPHADYGRPLLRLGTSGQGGADVDWLSASSVGPANLMQSCLEPLLKTRAEALAPGTVHFNRDFQSFVEDEDGILATIEDRASGELYQVRARYLLACDGGKLVGSQVGVALEGDLGIATSISFHFSADLSPWARDDDVLVRCICNPDIGIPRVLVPMGPRSWGTKSEEWVFHLLAFPGQHMEFDDAAAIAEMRRVLGIPDLEAQVHVINRWPLDAVVASKFRAGRVFLLGDAAHRMPPSGGHGLNTAVQDCYNLCWKLAAVLKGHADERLLDTYEAERRPLAQRTVASAFDNWKMSRLLTGAIGIVPTQSAEQNWQAARRLWGDGPESKVARRAVREALTVLLGAYNHINLSFGHTYADGALIDDGLPAPATIDEVQVYVPSTHPGHSMPHAWVEDLDGRTALGDLVASGRFTLIAGEEGDAWCTAAREVAASRGIALDAFTVGRSNADRADLRYEWTRKREFGPGGAVIVRPDRFIAWRAMTLDPDPAAVLQEVFSRILGHGAPAASSAPAARRSRPLASSEAIPFTTSP